jgi:hypothetical protein
VNYISTDLRVNERETDRVRGYRRVAEKDRVLGLSPSSISPLVLGEAFTV